MELCWMTWIKMEHVYNEYSLGSDVSTFPPNLPFLSLPKAAYYGFPPPPPNKWMLKLCYSFLNAG